MKPKSAQFLQYLSYTSDNDLHNNGGVTWLLDVHLNWNLQSPIMPTNHLSIHDLRKLWNEDFLPGKWQEIKVENINDLTQRWGPFKKVTGFYLAEIWYSIEPYKNSTVRQLSLVDQSNRSMLS